MTDRGWMSAAEFQKQLSKNKEYQQKLSAQEDTLRTKTKEFRKLERSILSDFAQLGVDAAALEYVKPEELDQLVLRNLLSWIERVQEEHFQETLIRLIAGTREPYDATVLANRFDASENELLKWAIAYTLAESEPRGIGDWLVARCQDEESGRARGELLLAVGRHLPPEVTRRMARKLVREFPEHAARVLSRVGRPEDEGLLRTVALTASNREAREIRKALRRLSKRAD